MSVSFSGWTFQPESISDLTLDLFDPDIAELKTAPQLSTGEKRPEAATELSLHRAIRLQTLFPMVTPQQSNGRAAFLHSLPAGM